MSTGGESAAAAPAGWVVVVPVKGTSVAKSRLETSRSSRAALATAMAIDTLTAVVAAEQVGAVIVVTSPEWANNCAGLPVRVVLERRRGGLDAAVLEGIEAAPSGRRIAVLLGDLPALAPVELDAALTAATAADRGFVPDAEGTGTVLITALEGVPHNPAFGADSAARHAAAGYRELVVAPESGLRSDVDTIEALERLRERVGGHTRSALG